MTGQAAETARVAAWTKLTQSKVALWALLIGCIIRQWIVPLPSSFWVDEAGTWFVVRHGADHPTFGVAPQVPQSIYYAIPAAIDKLAGFSEAAYRLPSAVLLGLALAIVAWLARRLIHREAGWFAVFACLSLRGFSYQAADARPYALGTAVAAVAMLLLVRWTESGRWRDGLLFAAVAAVLWRVHLVFWPMYFVFAIYPAVQILARKGSLTWLRAAVVFTALGALLVPVLTGAMDLMREADAHVVAPRPNTTELFRAIHINTLVGWIAGLSIVARRMRWPLVTQAPEWRSLSLPLAWWLCPAVCLFAFSWLTGASLFVPRYLSIALGGTGLVITAVAAQYINPERWRSISVLFGVGVLIFMGSWTRPVLRHHNSEWREASARLNALIGPETPVIAPSPFIEARSPVWRADYPLTSFLYCHLLVYPVRGAVLPFPFETSPEAEATAATLASGKLASAARFAILGGDRNVRFWSDWFRARPELSGWKSRNLGPFGDVEVALFERVTSPSPQRALD